MPIVVTGGHRRLPPVATPIEPAEPGVIERKSGAGYVRYEDTYVTGDTLQQTVDRVTGGRVLTFPDGEFLIPNNFPNGDREGFRIGHPSFGPGCRGISGSGPGTVFRMASSNRDPSGLGAFAPNPYMLMAAVGRTDLPKVAVEFSQFSLPSTIGHDHNGLRVHWCTNSLIEDVYVSGVKGSDKIPPGETGSVSMFECSNFDINRVEVDGRLGGAGGPRVSASCFMVNDSDHIDFTDCYAHHTRHGGGGIAWFHSTDSTVTDMRSHYIGSGTGIYGGYPFNHEQSTRITYVRPDMIADRQNSGGSLHMSLNADGQREGTDALITVIDPTWDNTGIGNGLFVVETWNLPQQMQRTPMRVFAADGVTKIPHYYINPFRTPVAGVVS